MINSFIEQAADANTHSDALHKLALKSTKFRYLVPNNYATPTQTLLVLSILMYKIEIYRSLIANPNTPIVKLIVLGAYFPYELINNPTFRLFAQKNPRLFQQMPIQTVKNILLLDDIPLEYMKMAALCNHVEILNIIANHSKAPKSLLLQIINQIKMSESANIALDSIAYVASQNVQVAGEITEGWNKEVWQAIKKYTFLHPNKEKEIFMYDVGILDKRMLLKLSDYTHLKIIAKSETPLEIAELVLDALSPEIRAAIDLSQPGYLDTHANTLIELANPKIIKILTAVASNPNSPLFVLEKLALIDCSEIKKAIYRNYNTSEFILKKLFTTDDSKPTLSSPQSARTSMLFYIKRYHLFKYSPHLSSSYINSICKLLLLSDNIDYNVYQELASIDNFDILIALARQPKNLAYIFKHLYVQSQYHQSDSSLINYIKKTIRILIAKNPQIPINILFNLLEDEHYQVCIEAITNLKNKSTSNNQQITDFLSTWECANNPATPQDVLSNIAYNSNVALCLAVANNPRTSSQTLHELTFHTNKNVLIAVSKNPNTSVKTLLALSKKSKGSLGIRAHAVKALIQKDPDSSGAVLAEVASSDKPTSTRFILLLHPITPPEFLVQHADSICWIERYAVAQNNSTPAHVISKLATDANRLVRAVALERLQTF
ncbi:hypothetical protein DSM106972_099060 [Dulcicalothrix desertica PCC 7102]|uniref:Uncharacterized protein n=1 Tax=Dulcicalothrix desertica PCC 7102 TaxID=232991 RepID=A0A433UF64_9CYAN|nr:hypothetical protein [Dulcicalothrix desertica]RUS92447.1 hypothetical protein DSM106972_099060 [Dulcicalothrix desertica PCC 7102]